MNHDIKKASIFIKNDCALAFSVHDVPHALTHESQGVHAEEAQGFLKRIIAHLAIFREIVKPRKNRD